MSAHSASGRAPDAASVTGGPRPGGRTGPALAVIVLCQLMLVLDLMIVQIALPDMARNLGLTTGSMSWVVNAYALAFGGLLLLGGRAGDILGRRAMFLSGVALFTLASLLGGLATEGWWLLTARAVQGVGAAMASPSTLALIVSVFEEGPRRARAIGVYSVVGGAGAALGLILGGVLTDVASWRWVLFVNVPVGVLVLALTPFLIGETPRRPGRFDLLGALTSTLGMAALVYGVISASDAGWGATATRVSCGAAVVLLPLFLVVESRARQPVLRLGLFRGRTRAGAYVAVLLVQGSMIGVLFFLSRYVQQVLHFTPLEAGLCFLPVTAVVVPLAKVVIGAFARFGGRPLVVFGAGLIALADLWLSRLGPDSGYLGGVLPALLVYGCGIAFSTIPLTMLAVSGVPPEEAGTASSVLNSLQQVGGSLGLAILVTVFDQGERRAARNAPHRAGTETAAGHLLTAGIDRGFTAAACFAAATVLPALLVLPGRPKDGRGTHRPEDRSGPDPAET
ncbi:MFS transporter [Streptomyces fuscichromogenes]|uniref:MFS transporter n=1 Tax=Streptomyces fuscichromogenes TaxID=1324013 RepID=A0A917XK08_9ACTN|nr:MFS transporter [Streptomyces fuscichromogenes]GGN33634.1 MFS transporter [Streptomyces fuscichromogenes]